jgi:hypothetical protein
MNGARFRFGPYVDEDNYAMLVLDDRDGGNDREGWSVEVAAGGEVVAQQAAEEPGLNYGFDELRRGLTVFANEGYQSFFLHYALAGETRADLSAWGEPVRLRADIETVGGGDPAFELRGIEHGYAKKGEGAFDGAFD